MIEVIYQVIEPSQDADCYQKLSFRGIQILYFMVMTLPACARFVALSNILIAFCRVNLRPYFYHSTPDYQRESKTHIV